MTAAAKPAPDLPVGVCWCLPARCKQLVSQGGVCPPCAQRAEPSRAAHVPAAARLALPGRHPAALALTDEPQWCEGIAVMPIPGEEAGGSRWCLAPAVPMGSWRLPAFHQAALQEDASGVF